MASDLSGWASGGVIRTPTAAEIAQGFSCGPADPELFNFLISALADCCPPLGVADGDTLAWNTALNGGAGGFEIATAPTQKRAHFSYFGVNTFVLKDNFFNSTPVPQPVDTTVINELPLTLDPVAGTVTVDADLRLRISTRYGFAMGGNLSNGTGLFMTWSILLNGVSIPSAVATVTDSGVVVGTNGIQASGASAFTADVKAGDIITFTARGSHLRAPSADSPVRFFGIDCHISEIPHTP